MSNRWRQAALPLIAGSLLVGAAAISDSAADSKDTDGHWAFQAPVRPVVPDTNRSDWTLNPIDSFIAQEHEKNGLNPQQPAAKSVLLRRLYLDLIGLPPSREQLIAFLADDSPDAYERQVTRLLDSPQYGERWARHWMDVWRYSDWYGRRMVPDVWNSAPQIWRWRDWIVHSLNRDKGYDRMVAEMLAGDEIDPSNDEAGYATGYLIRNWYALNPNDWMRNNVEHTGKAFLGLTFNCAHCHDHKYDPITQGDYFRFRAFFEPIGLRQDRVPGEPDPGPFQEYNYSTLRKIVRFGSVRLYDKSPDAATWFYTGGDERNRVTDKGSIAPGSPSFLAATPLQIEPIDLPAAAWYPGLRPAIQQTILAERRNGVGEAAKQLAEAKNAAETELPALRMAVSDAETNLAQARQAAEQSGQPGALSGTQSLLLDATAGRRALHNTLTQLKSLDDGTSINFQLRVLADAHVNFQLAKDVVKGLTAGYVAFEKGRIISYHPGSFNEFEVGRYDSANLPWRFQVTLVLQTKEDRCLITVRTCGEGEETLVDRVPVALNGWSLVGDGVQGVLFDARTGSVSAIDDLSLSGQRPAEVADGVESTRQLAHFDFESPKYTDGRDVAGIDGWQVSSFSQAPAVSFVSASAANPTLRKLADKVLGARRVVELHDYKLTSFQARLAAAESELASAESRIAADRAKFEGCSDASVQELTRVASRIERDAAVRSAEAEMLAKEQLVLAATVKPADDPNRVKEADAALAQIATARTALEKARSALTDDKLANTYTLLSPVYPKTSTGRRKALAEWITHRSNPLTARVAVNHIWMRHFHAPLVASVYDFGQNGAAPTHPKLLDWLAVEFMDSGWSMKHLHRLIVTSTTYRMASQSGRGVDNRVAIDPENKLLWRMNVGRMEAESLRDSLLYCANRLDIRMGGQELENSQALTTRRRTLYYSCQPELDGKSEFGALFDAPEASECYRRTRSVIPQQALALTNSELVHELSGALAAALWTGVSVEQRSDPAAFVVAAHEQILSRQPTPAELTVCVAFLRRNDTEESGSESDRMRLREGLVRVLLNHNDFLAIR